MALAASAGMSIIISFDTNRVSPTGGTVHPLRRAAILGPGAEGGAAGGAAPGAADGG